MQYQTITIEKRPSEVDAKQLKALRKSGRMPAVISRAGKEPLEVLADRVELSEAVRHTGIGGVLLLVEEGSSEKHLGILKELQWHPLNKTVLHASFQAVDQSQVVNTRVPLILQGEPDEVSRKTAQLLKHHEAIEVHAQVTDLPQAIAVDISGLKVGDTVTAADIVLPNGCEPTNPQEVMFQVAAAMEQAVEAPEVGAETSAEPELVAKKGGEESEA